MGMGNNKYEIKIKKQFLFTLICIFLKFFYYYKLLLIVNYFIFRHRNKQGNQLGHMNNPQSMNNNINNNNRPQEGPPGANLFIYNLPIEYREPELASVFAQVINLKK